MDDHPDTHPVDPLAPSSAPGMDGTSTVSLVPGVPSVERSPAAHPVFRRFQELWIGATAETIRRDLEEAHRLAGRIRGPDQELASAYLQALRRLERWLHDR